MDAALDFFGVVIEREPLPEPPSFYLWPENLEPFQFFLSLSTQWRVGVNGCTGLDYQVVRSEIEVREGSSCRAMVAQRRNRLFQMVQAMEVGALEGWQQRAQETRDAQPP
ncbi:DUF1799 domain-containing protein [Rhodoferax sp.]|uniref:DUF1799 domain-containing protein n=1 Tax=Rhodoferax sp. TaxID=50421 RepID=UPI00374D1152